jgi:segregation and condensation protein A
MLQEKRMIEEAIWTNPQIQNFVGEDDHPGLAVTLFDLVKTFEQILERAKSRPQYEVTPDEVSVPDMIRFLRRSLQELDSGAAVGLVPLFEKQKTRRAMICLFLAVLEMVKQQSIRLTQDENFGEIMVGRGAAFESAEVTGEEAARLEEEYKD